MRGLANPNLKLRRAKEHLDALEKEIHAFVESKPYQVSRHDDIPASEHIIEVSFSPLPIWPAGAIAGDFVYCLRASLDHLIHGLCRLNYGLTLYQSTPKRTSFPIIGEYTSNTLVSIRECTDGVSPEAVSIVESLQPYNHGPHYKLTHLWRLHLLSNIDKHRHIPLHSGACNIEFPKIPKNLAPKLDIINDRNIMRFPLAAKPYTNFDPVTKVEVQFGSESDGVVVTIDELRDIYGFVSEKVIPRFSNFFIYPEDADQ